MKKLFLVLIAVFVLLPEFAYAGSTADAILTGIIFSIIILPYYLFALIPYFIQKRNKGKSLFLSIITYILSIGGIVLANYHILRFRLPAFCFDGICIVFYLMALPFVIVIIQAINKDYYHRQFLKDEAGF